VAHPLSAAERVLDEVGIARPEDLELLELIAWERGALVQDRPLHGAEARLALVGRRALITISAAMADPRRRRFSMAHELGHLEMHRLQSSLALCTGEDIDDWRGRRASAHREQEANEFASALLLPARFLDPLCKHKAPSLELVAELADTFEVSLTATALRYLHFCNEACAVVFSQAGNIQWFRGSKDFDDLGVFVDVPSRLSRLSLAALFFQGRAIPPTRCHVNASAWFAPGRYKHDAVIYEQSRPMPQYNAVLTLLWVADEIEAEEDHEADGY
jgi:Zn-dependent peptidase ImmA (M78 family)